MLKLSKKADYALMALQYMAMVRSGETSPFNPNRIINTKEIAEEHHIPLELLAKVLQTLAKYDMVESQNGPKGGYLLAREPRDISIAQVLEAIEGPLGIADCYHHEKDEPASCEQMEHCNIRTPLLRVQESIFHLLSSMSIEDMMADPPLIIVESRKTKGVQL